MIVEMSRKFGSYTNPHPAFQSSPYGASVVHRKVVLYLEDPLLMYVQDIDR